MRISRPQMFMDIAHIVAKRSTCFRLNVGAVIVSDRRIVSIGYNGTPPGHAHCTGNSCPGAQGCSLTTHAEVNALEHLPAGITEPLDLYVTDSPCIDCTYRLTKDFRVKRLFFGTPYRIIDHLSYDGLPFKVYRITPAGYIIDWQTKDIVDVVS